MVGAVSAEAGAYARWRVWLTCNEGAHVMDVGIRLIAEHLHVKYTTDDTDVQQGRKGAPPVLVLWA